MYEIEEQVPKKRSILKNKDQASKMQAESDVLLTQESVKSVTFHKSVDDVEKERQCSQKMADCTVETEQEQSFAEVEKVDSLSKLEYINKEHLLRDRTRQIIETRERNKTFALYLDGILNAQQQKIARINKDIEKNTRIHKSVKQRFQNSKIEENTLKKKMSNLGEVISAAKEHVKEKVARFKETQEGIEEILCKIPKLEIEIYENTKKYENRISELKKYLADNSYVDKRQSSIENLKNKIEILKKTLEHQLEINKNISKKVNENINYKLQIEELENKEKQNMERISNVKNEIYTLNLLFKEKELENYKLNQDINNFENNSKEKIKNLENKKNEVNNYLIQINEDIANKTNSINNLKQKNEEIKTYFYKIQENFENVKNNLENERESSKTKINLLDERNNLITQELQEILTKKESFKNELNALKSKNLTLLNQKNDSIVKKIKLENEIHILEEVLNSQKIKNEFVIEKNNSFDDFENNIKIVEIELKQKRELLNKLQNSYKNRDDDLQNTFSDLEKKKDFLKTKSTYLNDKLQNLLKQKIDVETQNKNIESKILSYKKVINLDELTKKLSKEMSEYQKILEEQNVPPSILKSPKKIPAVSPKKVKFLNVPSSSEEDIKMDTKTDAYDEFIRKLEEAAASRPTQPASKKRRIDFFD